ncbi:30S ribosomal protein S16 [Candidatus Nasuia deltocephalinicola]|uniref:30S ribosomal protein S16 n=1 Tax=Candidatus Nasuia deltocephalincola TaxID=1160784 RepID=UPI00216AB678|nr:30S ribosomal protein S16 [Candidatus Nasuia deltocephalinicola]
MLKIRFFRKGLKRRPFYSLIVINSKNPRNGKFIDKIGFFDPFSKLKKIDLNKFLYWKSIGAKPTNSALKIINEFIKNNK